MKYLIGNVARLMNISIEGLRQYERSGIIEPKRSKESRYRRYDYLDITSLLRARTYRAFGFSHREIQEMTNELSCEEVCERMQQKREQLQREQFLLTEKIGLLDARIEELETMEKQLDQVQIVQRPALYRLEFSKNGSISSDPELIRLFQQWQEYMPFLEISTGYRDGEVFGALAIREEYARLWQIQAGKYVHYYPQSVCLCTVVEETTTPFSDVECANRLEQFAAQHNFRLADEKVGYSLVSVHKNRCYTRYRKVFAEIIL